MSPVKEKPAPKPPPAAPAAKGKSAAKVKQPLRARNRGPKPATFEKWVQSIGRRGARRFRVHLPDGETKIVALNNARDTARRIEKHEPTTVDALDEHNAELGDWTFPDVPPEDAAMVVAGADDPAGYLREEGDTEMVAVLKTFAHLLADAHKDAARQLVATVGLQSRHFSEERQNLLKLQLANERMLAKKLRGAARFRIATDPDGEGEEGEDEGEEGEDGEEKDGFLRELLEPMIRKYAAKMGGHVSDSLGGSAPAAAAANGAVRKEEKS